MVKIALDAMGGDNAPAEIVKGAVQAIAADKDCFVYLVGKEDKIKECLNGQQYDSSRIEIVNADDVIETGEPPVMAIRRKKESSLVKAMYMVKNKEADAFVSDHQQGLLLSFRQIRMHQLLYS
jgi:glycerol-3-phosphate acyltransferase PlsX